MQSTAALEQVMLTRAEAHPITEPGGITMICADLVRVRWAGPSKTNTSFPLTIRVDFMVSEKFGGRWTVPPGFARYRPRAVARGHQLNRVTRMSSSGVQRCR